MRPFCYSKIIIAIGVVFSLASCSLSETSIQGLWKDMNYQGGLYTKVAIVGVVESEIVRKLFEDELAGQLRKRGLEAIPSYTIVSTVKKGDKEALARKFEEMGIDAVLVTKLYKKEEVITYIPPTMYNYNHYYGSGYHGSGLMRSPGLAWSPGYYVEDNIVTMETNVFDVSSRNLIWSALTQTYIMGDVEGMNEIVEEFVEFLIKELKRGSYFKVQAKAH